MWQSSSSTHKTNIPIPPNVLKNFNTFDILEPQRNGAQNSDATKVDKLIDIDDSSQDSGFHDFESSLLNKKKDFTLIDVYENIFVTPQDIKVKNNMKEPITMSSTQNIDFKEFFDVIESGKKYDWEKPSSSKEKTAFKRDDHEDIVKPRVLLPPVFHETDLDPDELIYEVLAQKNIKKQHFNETKSKSSICSSTDVKHKSMTDDKPTLNNVTNTINNGVINDEIKQTDTDIPIKRINNNKFLVKAIKKDEKVYKKKRLVKPESQTSKFTKGPDIYEKSVVLPQIMERMFERQEYLDEKNNIKKRLLLDSGAKTLEAKSNISITEKDFKFEVKAGKNDDAVGVKAKKPDSIKLTEAIMSSANLQTCTSSKKGENLSTKATCSKITRDTDYGKVSPTVLMADCNKVRLEAWQRNQLFKNFVLKGKFEL